MSSATNILFVFPGQGAQYPGIGKDLYNSYDSVKQTYQEASDTLGYDMTNLSFNDPHNEINLTKYTQAVLVTHHVACLRLFNELSHNKFQASFAAGHSLGEYSALYAADSIEFSQALTLVSSRGELMSKYGKGEMAALMLNYADARALADEFYCGVAALNLPEQTVVGGLSEDLTALASLMSERFPRKRSTILKTEGAFHTYYMVESAKYFREVLDQHDFKPPKINVCSNYSGIFHQTSAASIRSRLFMQLFNPVLWVNNLNHLLDKNIDLIIEFGGGIGAGETAADKRPNLEGIVKKTFCQQAVPPKQLSVINLKSLESTLSSL